MISPEWKVFLERVFTPKKKGIFPGAPWGILILWVAVFLMLDISAIAGWVWDTYYDIPTNFRGRSGFVIMLLAMLKVNFVAILGCALSAAITILKEHREEFLTLIRKTWRR